MNASTNRTRGFLPPGCRGYPIISELAAKATLRAQRDSFRIDRLSGNSVVRRIVRGDDSGRGVLSMNDENWVQWNAQSDSVWLRSVKADFCMV